MTTDDGPRKARQTRKARRTKKKEEGRENRMTRKAMDILEAGVVRSASLLANRSIKARVCTGTVKKDAVLIDAGE